MTRLASTARRPHWQVYPPSATTIAPVMRLEASDARNWTMEATSSGVPMRPRGILLIQSFVLSSSVETESSSEFS